MLGNKWREAAPVFQILAISALGQLLLESTIWLFVSRGQSERLLKLLLMISPVIVGSFAIGLPFGIKGVALSGSMVLVAIFPWILKFAFRGTNLTLWRLGRAIFCPVSLSLGARSGGTCSPRYRSTAYCLAASGSGARFCSNLFAFDSDITSAEGDHVL